MNLNLTPNAMTVLEKRYLRDGETPEQMFRRVAHNIALAEVLHADLGMRPFEGVIWKGEWMGESARAGLLMLLRHRDLQTDDDGDDTSAYDKNFSRFLSNLERLYPEVPRAATIEAGFYEMMTSLDFLPNSPTLMNAGGPLQQLAACFVLPIHDSLHSIYRTMLDAAIIHKTGGGTGFSFSELRPRGDAVKTTKGVSSGPVGFLQVYNSSTQEIKQGGTRRGANMGVLRVDHPDIFEFITCKSKDEDVQNFNISVAITDKFMSALGDDGPFDLLHPRDKTVVRTVKAREIWSALIKNAWATGDPGVLFIDRANAANTVIALGEFQACNPCSEQWLQPHDACNLGSINLSNYVRADKTLDLPRLEGTIRLATRFLDNVIDMNKYPLAQIEKMTKGNRRIGLGVMGWADMLAKMGIDYDSPRAIGLAHIVMGAVDMVSLEASKGLAAERCVFPHYEKSIFPNQGVRLRNCARTTVAPTGTIAMIAGCFGGIEPFFSLYSEKHVMDGTVLTELNPHLEKELRERGLYSEEMVSRIRAAGTIQKFHDLPEDLRKAFKVAADISPLGHINMLAAFQEHVDSSVSKTINFPNSASELEIASAYQMAFDAGCKGVSVYRDGSKGTQVYYTPKTDSKRCPDCASALVFDLGCKSGSCPNPECSYAVCLV